MGGKELTRNFFYWHRFMCGAEELDDLALECWQPAESFLIVGGQLFINEFFEGADEGIEGVAVDEVGEDDEEPLVTSGKVMERADTGSSAGGAYETR